MKRNLKNNSLSGSIPESLGQLNRLVYLDISNNQLTGPFPGWVNRLESLTLLNLGQNYFSGNIPRSFRLEHNGSHRFLNNMPLLMRQLIRPISNGRILPYRDVWKRLIQNILPFYRNHKAFKHISPNMLWVDAENIDNRDALELEKIVDEYLKAEEMHLFTKVFEIMRNQNNGRLQDLFQNGYIVTRIEGS
jgi:hypothetical protein